MNIGSKQRDNDIAAIETLLESGERLLVSEIAARLGISVDGARKWLKRMALDGMVDVSIRMVKGHAARQYSKGDVSVIKREPVKVVVRRDWAVAAVHGPARISSSVVNQETV